MTFSEGGIPTNFGALISNFLALRQTQWDEEERGDKRRRKTIRKRERQRG